MSQKLVDRFGRLIPELSNVDLANVHHVLNLSKPGIPITHDLSDKKEFDFVVRQHGGREFLEKHYPATLHLLEQGSQKAKNMKKKGIDPRRQHVSLLQMDTPPTDEWMTVHAITNASFLANNSKTYQASGISSVLHGTYFTHLTMTLYDVTAGYKMIAQESVPNVYDRGYYVSINAKGDVSTLGHQARAAMTVTFVPQGDVDDQHHAISTTYWSDIDNVCPISPPTVTEPVHKRTQSGEPIKVALNRTSAQQHDCDYYYETDQTGRHPDVEIEVSGSVEFQNNVCTPFTFDNNLFGKLMLIRRTEPAGGTLALKDADFVKGITATGGRLSWHWGGDNMFGEAPWNQNELVDIILNIRVVVSDQCTGQTAPNAEISVLSSATAIPDKSTTKIDPLTFVWGCLAAETMILMADGERKPLELVKFGDRVVCGNYGQKAEVVDTISGFEDREPCLRITAGDMQVIVTKDHPLLAPEGPILAAELVIGGKLLSMAGEVEITDITQIRYDNQVFNLKLKPLNFTPMHKAPGVVGFTHFANDFLVGDSEMQRSLTQLKQQRGGDHKTVLSTLPQQYHMDYINLQRAQRGESLLTTAP
jgi:hypothetical protein